MAASTFSHPLSVKGYDILQKIGSGSYSTVYKAINLTSGECVAVKCVLKSNLSQTGRDHIVSEIQIMKMLKHEFVLNLQDFQYDERYVYMILDLCDGGDLSTFIKSKRKLSEKTCKKFMQQLVLGLMFLRSKDITHFDLKPQNLLIVTHPVLSIKIADFGLSGFLSDSTHSNVLKGSPLYMAPEILLGRPVDAKADLWSVGVIFYECLIGMAPLAHTSCRALVRTLSAEVPINIPPGLSEAAADLLGRLLVIRPDLRISFDNLFAHRFLDLEHYPSEESYVKAVALARRAVMLDFEKNYLDALNQYCSSLSYLVPFLSTPLPQEREEFIRKKVMEYFRRAEVLKSVLYKAKEFIGSSSLPKPKALLCTPDTPLLPVTLNLATADLGAAQSDSEVNQPVRVLKQLALVQQNLSGEYESSEKLVTGPIGEIDFKALKTMCSSTPKMEDGLDIGLMAQMYLYEGNYSQAFAYYKRCLNILVPLLEIEPPTLRRAVLTKLTVEWLKEAESAEALAAAVEESKEHQEESCALQ